MDFFELRREDHIMSYKILCIDGGGIRGVFSLEILKMLQEDLGKDLFEKFDCFAGTSTGALIASALLQGFGPRELTHFYTIFGRKIFPKRRRNIKNEAKYNQDFLEIILKTTVSEKTTFADLDKHLIIPACTLCDSDGRFGVEIYDNYDVEIAKNWNLVDIALRSSAAPIYFPSHNQYIDGGLYALNPSLLALSRAIDPKGGNKELQDLKILSIGTGINPTAIKGSINWGLDQWLSPVDDLGAHPLISLITDIVATIPNYPLEQLLKNKYLRINGLLSVPIEIDDPSKIALLRKAARDIKEETPRIWDHYIKWMVL